MRLEILLLPAIALLLAAFLTWVVMRRAQDTGLIDVPNERSSHRYPTPRGGGTAIVAVTSLGFVLLALRQVIDVRLLAALVAGLVVAAIGFVDDRRPLSARSRLIVQTLVTLWALGCLGGLHEVRIGSSLWSTHVGGYVLGLVGTVWTINLFNFMDGIDGLAAAEAIFMTAAAALLGAFAGVAPRLIPAELLFAAACCGFALWNWPPARIFMGDVGSGYLGYLLAVLALAASRDSPVALPIWVTLGGVFLIDATVTVVRRFLRGEPVHRPHRTHAYQWLARRWRSHERTTLAVTAVNLLWLLPWAWFEARQPAYAVSGAVIALAPLVVLAIAAGAGRDEVETVARADSN